MGRKTLPIGVNGCAMGVNQPEMGVNYPEMGVNHPEMAVNHPEMGVNPPEMGVNPPEMGVKNLELGVNGSTWAAKNLAASFGKTRVKASWPRRAAATVGVGQLDGSQPVVRGFRE